MKVISLIVGISALLPASIASAQGLTAVRPLQGYSCMRLKLTPEQVVDRNLQIPVYTAPSTSSPKVGNASAIVIVRTPLHVENGLAEVLFLDGRQGWLSRELLRPYATAEFPNAQCTPSIMSNGRPGFG